MEKGPVNPIAEHEDRGKQRMAFLCEVYKRTEGNPSKAIPYEEIANSLNFEDEAIAHVYYYFLHEGYILEVPPMSVDVIPPEGRASGNLKTIYRKAMAITKKGIEMATKISSRAPVKRAVGHPPGFSEAMLTQPRQQVSFRHDGYNVGILTSIGFQAL